MPVEHIYTSTQHLWGFWKITEDEEQLQTSVTEEHIPTNLSNVSKRLEFLAGRVLIKAMLERWGLAFPGITKDIYGKPYLKNSSMQISLSHSFPYVAAVLHREKIVGIDLEQPKEKLLRIAPRVLSQGELRDAGNDVNKHCIYWCAKEALIKIYGKKDLVLSRHLAIEPFRLQKKGDLVGRIIANNTSTSIALEYVVSDNFVVVVSA